MQSSLSIVVTGEDVRAIQNAPFKVGDFLNYVRTRKAILDDFVVARVNGVIGVHRGTPAGAQMIGLVTGVWSRV
jgi:hypothetical protein